MIQCISSDKLSGSWEARQVKYTAVELHIWLNHFESSGIFVNALKEIYSVRTCWAVCKTARLLKQGHVLWHAQWLAFVQRLRRLRAPWGPRSHHTRAKSSVPVQMWTWQETMRRVGEKIMLEAAQWRSPLHFRNPHIRITCAVPLKKWRWQSRMGYPVARSLNSRCRSQTCVRLVHPSSFVLWYCLAWLQGLKSDFPKVLTIVEEEVFIWVPEAAKEDATMIGASLSFQTGNLNVNYSLLCSSNGSILFNWANEHSAYMCPTGVHWTETIQCWDKSSWNTACQNAFKRIVFKQSSAKPSGARCAMLCSKIFPNPTLLLNPAHAGKLLTVAVSYRILWLHVTKRHKAPGRQAACSVGTRMDHWWLLQHFVADSTS